MQVDGELLVTGVEHHERQLAELCAQPNTCVVYPDPSSMTVAEFHERLCRGEVPCPTAGCAPCVSEPESESEPTLQGSADRVHSNEDGMNNNSGTIDNSNDSNDDDNSNDNNNNNRNNNKSVDDDHANMTQGTDVAHNTTPSEQHARDVGRWTDAPLGPETPAGTLLSEPVVPMNFIFLDATWPQARTLVKRLPGNLPYVRLSPPASFRSVLEPWLETERDRACSNANRWCNVMRLVTVVHFLLYSVYFPFFCAVYVLMQICPPNKVAHRGCLSVQLNMCPMCNFWLILCPCICMSCFMSRVLCLGIGGAREPSFGAWSLGGCGGRGGYAVR